MNPYQVVKDFEKGVAEYTGAPYVVAVNSCTSALLLAVAWHLRSKLAWPVPKDSAYFAQCEQEGRLRVEIPKRTYVSVPMSIIHAGGRPTFRDEEWRGMYQLKPLLVFDSARYFTAGMYNGARVHEFRGGPVRGIIQAVPGTMLCVSFHASKTLGDTQGGAILLDDYAAYEWLKKARFDGRTERVPPNLDTFTMIGHHCYLSADVAARLLLKLHSLPKNNEPLPNDDYPDLSQMEIFK